MALHAFSWSVKNAICIKQHPIPPLVGAPPPPSPQLLHNPGLASQDEYLAAVALMVTCVISGVGRSLELSVSEEEYDTVQTASSNADRCRGGGGRDVHGMGTCYMDPASVQIRASVPVPRWSDAVGQRGPWSPLCGGQRHR